MNKKISEEKYKNKYLMLIADIDNIKKRCLKDIEKNKKFLSEDIFKKILPVLDSLNILKKSFTDLNSKNSVRSIIRLFNSLFKINNIKEINPKKFSKFDPKFHQAITRVNSFKKHNLIFNVFQRGYLIFNKVLRPALVCIT
ncbi:nucleotide exchange factor GrpE [Candidatus Vidania fulgoroideorum]